MVQFDHQVRATHSNFNSLHNGYVYQAIVPASDIAQMTHLPGRNKARSTAAHLMQKGCVGVPGTPRCGA